MNPPHNPLTAANEARLNKALDKLYRWSGVVESTRDRIDRGHYDGVTIYTVSAVKYNRHKFNRMNHKEQEEYERKMAKNKLEYGLNIKGESGTSEICGKLIADYYKRRFPDHPVKEMHCNHYSKKAA